MNYRKHESKRRLLHLLTMPFIWLPLLFALALDLVLEIYQAVAFPIYGIQKVRRADYILVRDRNKLAYLNNREKLGCMYCGYMNGLFLYLKEMAGRTEKYWCGIMHENKPGFKVQADQVRDKFAAFGDKKDFQKKYGAKKG